MGFLYGTYVCPDSTEWKIKNVIPMQNATLNADQSYENYTLVIPSVLTDKNILREGNLVIRNMPT